MTTTTGHPEPPAASSNPSSNPGDPEFVQAEPGWRERLERVFERHQAARWRLMQSGADTRIAKLKRLRRWVESHQDEIRAAGHQDFGKPATEVELTEIWPVLHEASYAIEHLAKWMEPQRVRPTLALASTCSWVVPEARGAALVISPWNYPLNLSLGPMISAIAAGCTVVLKPSESVPAHSALLRRLVAEVFEEDEVACFVGDAEVAKGLLEKPFDHVFFTGSTEIGQKIWAAAGEHMASVTLELGGKSPVVVGPTARLKDAAQKIAWGKFINAGQTCIAPDYVLVHESVRDALVDRLRRQIERFYGSSVAARRASPDLARIVNDRHFERLTRLLDRSVAQGANQVFGGHRDSETRYLEPTLLTDVDGDSPAMESEIFGPILPILTYRTLDDALGSIRSRPKPLALYVFETDKEAVRQVVAGTSAGGTCINEVALHFLHPRLPFGGVNHSGFGSSHGKWGFEAFSHHRAMLRHHRWSALKAMAPPYGRLARWLSKATVRFLG